MDNKLFVIVLLLFITGCGSKKYEDDMRECVNVMSDLFQTSKKVSFAYSEVWRNAIFDNKDHNGEYCSDFNEAISRYKNQVANLYFIAKGVKSKKDKLDLLIKELKNPPSKYKETYNQIISVYADVQKMIELSDNPSGSLNSYSETISELDCQIEKDIKILSISTSK